LLLAQGRTGDILDGRLNWSNIDSLFGDIAFRLPRWTNYDASAEVKLGSSSFVVASEAGGVITRHGRNG
jgi:hypothetical protein